MANEIIIIIALVLLHFSSTNHAASEQEGNYVKKSDLLSVHMACSQLKSADVTCQFSFTNNGHEDYYLLKRDTPLEGLRSKFLTITHGNQIIKYEGIRSTQYFLPTERNEYILIPAGDTIYSPSIILNDDYKLTNDGQYTIQYTGTLVYFTADNMNSILQKDPQSLNTKRQVLASIDVFISGDNCQIAKGITTQKDKPCIAPKLSGFFKPCDDNIKKQITELHNDMCKSSSGLPKALEYIKNRKPPLYEIWFDRKRDRRRIEQVQKVLATILDGLKRSKKTFIYMKGDGNSTKQTCQKEASAHAYWDPNETKDNIIVHLCTPFFTKLQKDSSKGDVRRSRRTAILHVWSRIFGKTFPFQVKGDSNAMICKNFAKNDPNKAVNNADNYAFYYSAVHRLFVHPISCKKIKEDNPNSLSGKYLLRGRNGDGFLTYCNMGELCGSGGGWTRLAYLNMSDASQNCPTGFRLYNLGKGVRACGRPTSKVGSCQSVIFSSYDISYSQICGRVIGYSYKTPDAVHTYGGEHSNLNSYYVDGVSITRGTPRQHVWTFMATSATTLIDKGAYNCPCFKGSKQRTQSFVGNNYFCESGSQDPLWDGKECMPLARACCSVSGIPWFHRDYGVTTTNDFLELRVCGDQLTDDEDVPVGQYEIYVK